VSADPAARRLAEQRMIAEVTWKMDLDAVRAEGEAVGEARGEARGEAAGKREAIADLCEVFGIELTVAQREALRTMTVSELDELRAAIKRERRWPT
jgi:hypothetical protein